MEVPGSVTCYTAHMYSIQAKCLVGEKKETSGIRRVVHAAAVAKYCLKFLYTSPLRYLSLQVVSSPEASLGALDGMVLYKTPLWDAIPLKVV
jgi:hypothetical protein